MPHSEKYGITSKNQSNLEQSFFRRHLIYLDLFAVSDNSQKQTRLKRLSNEQSLLEISLKIPNFGLD